MTDPAALPSLEVLATAGVLSPLDVGFARAGGRLCGEDGALVLLAAALASRQVAQGHVCLDLGRIGELTLEADAEQAQGPIPWTPPPPATWERELVKSPMVGGASPGSSLLVLDARGRLYLRRYWEHEAAVARALLARAEPLDDSPGGAALEAALDRLFGRETGERDLQREAARVTLQRRLAVVSGGPGTGKTATVVKILALLLERDPSLRVHLMAPTGKAAARLTESIRRAKEHLPVAAAVRARIPEEAATIHRALGTVRHRATRFRHDADHPLVTDLVLVDEASMVDLALMRRLLDALPARARLILLGDESQLASVEAGAVLGDVCGVGAEPRAARAEGQLSLFADGGAPAPLEPPLARSIVRLTRSYRYDAGSGIGDLARAIDAGDARAALGVLSDGRRPDVSLAPPPPRDGLGDALLACALGGYRAFCEATAPEARLRALDGFRILCAHRRGPWGVEQLNPRVEQALRAEGLLGEPVGAQYRGRPVMVARNDYEAGLFNGDVGVVDAQGDSLRAFFLGTDAALRALSTTRLPSHETVFAMTVHKSQGSEFDEVAVVLPEEPSPILTRELLYTAVTRARRRVTVHAAPEVVAAAIGARVTRTSGLRDALWVNETKGV